VPELTYAANAVQSYYFVPFESFLVATLLYWVLCGASKISCGTGAGGCACGGADMADGNSVPAVEVRGVASASVTMSALQNPTCA